MQTITAFWSALDEIPGIATDARDWRCRLGDEFEHVSRFLRRTGRLARGIDCPSPGGDGCPRRVIKRPGGGWRAVCGSRDSRCDVLDLSADDIAVLALDRAKLVTELVRAFGLTSPPATTTQGRVIDLGTYAVAEGLGSPAFLVMPGQQDPLGTDDLHGAGLPIAHAVIFVPCRKSLSQTLRIRLGAVGHYLVYLAEAVGVDPAGRIGLVQPIELLLQPVRDHLLARLQSISDGPSIVLPVGTIWEQITLTFTSSETLICSAPGISRRVEPSQFGMRSAKSARPTLAWISLLSMARTGGRLPCVRPADQSRVRKQKQELSTRLQRSLGIADDPMPWIKAEGAYIARFILRDERPLEERRQEARQ